MRTRLRLFGHPVHPLLVVFPLGLLGGATIFDIIYLYHPEERWGNAAFYLIPLGLAFGLLAGLTGFIDWLTIPNGTRAKQIGIAHSLTNVTMLALYGISAWLRWEDPAHPDPMDMAFSFIGAALAVFGGWFGGELVYRMGIGVEHDAHPNAPHVVVSPPPTSNPGATFDQPSIVPSTKNLAM